MMRFITVILAGLVTIVASGSTVRAQSLSDLLEEGIFKEETVGDLDAAIKIYEQIVAEGAKNRSYAAQAQYRVGMCYLKKGKTDEAVAALQKLVADFPRQKELVARASARLKELGFPVTPAGAAPPGLIVRKIWSGTEPTVDTLGTPTPDGRYLTFVDWTTGDLAIRDVATGESRRLTNRGYPEYALGSSVSPDGRKVAYFWTVGPKWHPQLWVVGIDGSDAHPLLENSGNDPGYLFPVGWTPDSQRVLVKLTRGDTTQLAFVSLEDGGLKVVRTHDRGSIFKAALSPDGRWIVYDFPPSEESPQRDIYLLAADGSREIPLVRHSARDIFPIWTPDGKRVLFSSDRSGSTGLWSIRVHDGRPVGQAEAIKLDMEQGFWPMGFTREGALFYATELAGGDVYTAEINPKTGAGRSEPRRTVHQFQGRNTSPSWSPDGKRLAYVSRRRRVTTLGHSAVLIVRDVGSGKELEVSGLWVNRKWSRPKWSPDGRTILVNHARTRKKRRDSGLYRVDASSGAFEPVYLSREDKRVFHGFWSPDGRSILFIWENWRTPDTEGAVGISRLNLETGEEQLISTPVMDNGKRGVWAPSPDGASIALVGRASEDESVLYVVPIEGGKPREILRIEKPRYFRGEVGLAWTADGRHLLFALGQAEESKKDPVELLRLAIDGGEPEPVGIAMREIRHLSVLPDGRGISFAAGPMTHHEVWVMENFLPEPRPTVAAAEASGRPVARMLLSAQEINLNSFFLMKPSPDGQLVAYSSLEGTEGGLYVRDLASGKTTAVTTGEFVSTPIWSLDGKRVAYMTFGRDKFKTRIAEVASRTVTELPVSEELQVQPLDWSPDGRRLLCNVTRMDKTSSLVLLSLPSGEITPLISQGWNPRSSGVFSRDGRFVAFSAVEDGNRDVFVIAVDGSRKHRITNKPGADRDPLWSPSGDRLVYQNEDGVWAIAVSDGRPQGTAQLVSSEPVDQPLSWTAAGGFTYVKYNAVFTHYSLPVDPDTGKPLGSPAPLDVKLEKAQRFAWSPDMKCIALTRYRDGKIHIYSTIDETLRSFPTGIERAPSKLWWSGDGDSVLFVPYGGSGQGRTILAMNPKDGDIRPLFPRMHDAGKFDLSADGHRMLFYKRIGGRNSGRRQLVVTKVGEKDGLVLASEQDPDGGFSAWVRPVFSPDGSYVLFSRARWEEGDNTLWVVSSDGSDKRKLATVTFDPEGATGGGSDKPFLHYAVWHPGGRYIAYDDSISLFVVNVKTGEQQEISLRQGFGEVGVMQWSPDGKQIGLLGEKANYELWTTKNLLGDESERRTAAR